RPSASTAATFFSRQDSPLTKSSGSASGRSFSCRPRKARNREQKEEPMAGLYFEDFVVGQEFSHVLTRTVTEMGHTLFSLLTLHPQLLHIDAHFAAKTQFGHPICN